MINELLKLANHLDKNGLIKEADYLDHIIKSANEDYMTKSPAIVQELVSTLNAAGYTTSIYSVGYTVPGFDESGRKKGEEEVCSVAITIQKNDEGGKRWQAVFGFGQDICPNDVNIPVPE